MWKCVQPRKSSCCSAEATGVQNNKLERMAAFSLADVKWLSAFCLHIHVRGNSQFSVSVLLFLNVIFPAPCLWIEYQVDWAPYPVCCWLTELVLETACTLWCPELICSLHSSLTSMHSFRQCNLQEVLDRQIRQRPPDQCVGGTGSF